MRPCYRHRKGPVEPIRVSVGSLAYPLIRLFASPHLGPEAAREAQRLRRRSAAVPLDFAGDGGVCPKLAVRVVAVAQVIDDPAAGIDRYSAYAALRVIRPACRKKGRPSFFSTIIELLRIAGTATM